MTMYTPDRDQKYSGTFMQNDSIACERFEVSSQWRAIVKNRGNNKSKRPKSWKSQILRQQNYINNSET